MINKKRALQTMSVAPSDNIFEFYREIQKDVQKEFYKEKGILVAAKSREAVLDTTIEVFKALGVSL